MLQTCSADQISGYSKLLLCVSWPMHILTGTLNNIGKWLLMQLVGKSYLNKVFLILFFLISLNGWFWTFVFYAWFNSTLDPYHLSPNFRSFSATVSIKVSLEASSTLNFFKRHCPIIIFSLNFEIFPNISNATKKYLFHYFFFRPCELCKWRCFLLTLYISCFKLPPAIDSSAMKW